MNHLKISVITVTFNSAATLEETIKSVINQTYDNIEYIIIDGGSTDGTVDIIKNYSDKIAYWVSEPDKGIYDAMNKGVERATGDYTNFMNAGDTFADLRIVENVVNKIDNRHAVIFGDTYILQESKAILQKAHPFYLQTQKYKHPGICHQSTLVCTSVLKKYGFNTHYRIAADYDLLHRLYRSGKKFQYIPKGISIYDTSGLSSKMVFQREREFAKINEISTISPFYIMRSFRILCRQFLNI